MFVEKIVKDSLKKGKISVLGKERMLSYRCVTHPGKKRKFLK